MSLPFFFFLPPVLSSEYSATINLQVSTVAKKRESFWICSLVLDWRPETRTPNAERKYRNSSFLPLFCFYFLAPAPREFFCRGRKRKLQKTEKAKTPREECLPLLWLYLQFQKGEEGGPTAFYISLPHTSRARIWVLSWKCIKEHGIVVSLDIPPKKMEPLKIKVLERS